MSANLNKSLDEIIGTRPKRATRGARAAAPRRATKQVNHRRSQPVNRQRTSRGPANAVSRVARMLNSSASSLTKVNVEGLPRDIKQDAVREFFSSQVGGVQSVLLSYNERGQSTGMANITFRNSESAKVAVNKFNGAPIDGGRSKLRLNLIVDPTQSRQDLSQRIKPLPTRGQNQGPQRGNRPAAPVRGPNRKAALAKKKTQRPKKEKPAKKSLEDLDKEMADYFGDSSNAAAATGN
ncbi:hypothetical protein KAFR_0E03720 [Kazachstania africana CBS 2517]|uniref:RRM domain-containing protein n=1 Tax=Kazachstania africana (strain ATCC 22294 / BCRC 22015 / CBS 2517 / CECT 1963 / NBRC 1671 / NRRL Y-8276) TaxID=1071382 RepID=H2AVX3_KAZAF|nr:hypothetical protein KAFR_0E03720 [Kazachstania africana CBS 2517]CCF58523.1 hypothetical protein KAFR_0E03720 [Kazachstania africana CBS 2517]